MTKEIKDLRVALHARIREDIIEGRIPAGSRLVVADLAKRYHSSSNPVREALHHLQGEGFVQIALNRGARVRALDADFVRNIYDIRALIEPYFTRWFVQNATDDEIGELSQVQKNIEKISGNFEDYRALNERFHSIIYSRHFNLEALDLEFRQREVLFMLNRRYPITRGRWQAILLEHAAIIDAVKNHQVEEAGRRTELHVRGACQHLLEHMRSGRHGQKTT